MKHQTTPAKECSNEKTETVQDIIKSITEGEIKTQKEESKREFLLAFTTQQKLKDI